MAFSKRELIKYCAEKGIATSANPTKKELEAAIFRASKHLSDVKAETCFGYWEDDNMVCEFCDHVDKCKVASLGTDKKVSTYKIRLEKKRRGR